MLDLRLKILHELIILPDQTFLLLILVVDQLIVTRFKLSIAFKHLINLLIQTIFVGLHTIQLLVDLFTFTSLNLQLILQLLLALHGNTARFSGCQRTYTLTRTHTLRQ